MWGLGLASFRHGNGSDDFNPVQAEVIEERCVHEVSVVRHRPDGAGDIDRQVVRVHTMV